MQLDILSTSNHCIQPRMLLLPVGFIRVVQRAQGTGTLDVMSIKIELKSFGGTGTLEFSVFDELPLLLNNNQGQQEIYIDNPENIQLFHVISIKDHLLGIAEHPSTGYTATHTSWVMDRILGRL